MHSIEKTFGAAMNKGVTVVVASGNSRSDACGFTPAFAPSAITVGATSLQGSRDARTGFSNYGKCVDILAPGYQIESASHRSTTGSAKMSGTSMACPHVAGGVALLLGDNPSMSPHAVDKTLKANALKNIVSDAKGPNLFLYVANQPAPAPMPAPTPAPPAPAPTPGSSGSWQQIQEMGKRLNNLEALLAAIVKKLQSRTTTTDLPTTTTDFWAAPTTTTMPNLVNTYTTTAPPTIAPSPGIPPAVRDQMNKMHSRMSSMEGMLQRILAAIKARGGNR